MLKFCNILKLKKDWLAVGVGVTTVHPRCGRSPGPTTLSLVSAGAVPHRRSSPPALIKRTSLYCLSANQNISASFPKQTFFYIYLKNNVICACCGSNWQYINLNNNQIKFLYDKQKIQHTFFHFPFKFLIIVWIVYHLLGTKKVKICLVYFWITLYPSRNNTATTTGVYPTRNGSLHLWRRKSK